MKVKNKAKPNRYKPEKRKDPHASDSGFSIDFCLKWIMLVTGISLLSLTCIFGYDLVTQSKFFNVKKIEISGNNRISADEIKSFAGLDQPHNIFKLNVHALEMKISSHPWIEWTSVKRNFTSGLDIQVVEHRALAIVKIENIADILINTRGRPFKEYNPSTDQIESLPIITGLDLTQSESGYLFDGIRFNAVMDFLKIADQRTIYKITADDQIGLTIETDTIYNKTEDQEKKRVQIRLGFGSFQQKMDRAETISQYLDQYFPDREIIAMDVFNLDKIFVKTKMNDPDQNVIEKGV